MKLLKAIFLAAVGILAVVIGGIVDEYFRPYRKIQMRRKEAPTK